MRTFRASVFAASVALSVAGCSKAPTQSVKAASKPISVYVVPVSVRQVQRSVEAVGTLFPYEEVTVSSEIEGRALEVPIDLGDRVTQGQILVRVADEEQRYILTQNEAQLTEALGRLGLKSPSERVKDINDTPEVRRAKADLFDAEQRYRRLKDLVSQGIGSRQDLDQAQANFLARQAEVETAANTTRNLIQEVERSKAVLDLQRKKLRDTTIRAPFAGDIKERLVNVGTYLRPNTAVFTLVKTDPLRLRIEVPERMAPWVRIGQSASVSMEAFPGREFKGKVWRISPTVEQTKRTFIVEALLANGNRDLKAGSYAKATIRTNRYDRVNTVPGRAVNYVFGANKVYVVEGNKIDAREVKLGDRFGDDLEIADGVREGERVATNDLPQLDTGVRVQVTDELASHPADPSRRSD
jgi:RND family efflux transporter MFP subunit